MLAASTELKNAQKVREYLIRNHLIDPNYFPVKELGEMYFPLIKKTRVPGAKVVEVRFSFPLKFRPPTIKELLKRKLTKKEMALIPKSQEIIGKIMILEIPEELQHKDKIIAEAYLLSNKNIETVVKKDELHSGIYRTRKVKVLAGKDQKETIHTENGVKMWVNLEETYFSARLAHERLRIAQQVKSGEEVLVMFSGVAPYQLVLAENSPAKMIYGIEINPFAHQLALKNIALNNFQHKVIVYEGEVRSLVPKLLSKKRFDRIIMPLPKTGGEFLDMALLVAKKGTLIHLYAFLGEGEIESEKKKIKNRCVKLMCPVKILRAVKCGQFSPRVFRVCFDLKIENRGYSKSSIINEKQ
ncbi:class I SAM-dependent methyltransferase family protein [Candidatus Woesearchaeota archaeon]|nr:class I SAM-dependent methyltransferase family protein [Candidatus Woesearchaeota archaeon]